jgi:hypothetical protein
MSPISILEPPPAIFDPDWFPPFVGPLDDLRRAHVALLNRRKVASAALAAVRERHEAEDQARDAALREAALTGAEVKAEAFTLPNVRRDELAEVERSARAINLAIVDFANEAVASIEASFAEQMQTLDVVEAAVERDIAEAMARLREAESQRGVTFRLREWIDRTGRRANQASFLHLAFARIPAPPPGGTEGARKLQEDMRRSYENVGERYVTNAEQDASRERDERAAGRAVENA